MAFNVVIAIACMKKCEISEEFRLVPKITSNRAL